MMNLVFARVLRACSQPHRSLNRQIKLQSSKRQPPQMASFLSISKAGEPLDSLVEKSHAVDRPEGMHVQIQMLAVRCKCARLKHCLSPLLRSAHLNPLKDLISVVFNFVFSTSSYVALVLSECLHFSIYWNHVLRSVIISGTL